MHTPTPLSHDQRAAAEAAYYGRPLNPKWSLKAKAVYHGIWAVKQKSASSLHAQPHLGGTPSPNIPLQTPLIARPVQAWHIRYLDHSEDLIMLFPLSDTMQDVLHLVRRLHPTRPFEMQPLKSGQFQIPHTIRPQIEQAYAQDARRINHLGQVFLSRSTHQHP